MKHLHPLAFGLSLVILVFAGCAKQEGCTYPEACNYDADAVVDNGSCDFATCAGCTDAEALNFDASATVDDGSCVYDPVPSTAECVTSVEFDSYTYPVVAVGPQCWFAENLRTTVYQDGSPIAEETVANFPNLNSPARTVYNSSSTIINTHGFLYNGIAASTSLNGGICPTGWHVPTELDWMEMESYLVIAGHGKRMGEVLKKSSGWQQQGNGSDLYGWNGTGSGHAWPDGNAHSLNWFGTYWSSTTTNDGDVMQRTLSSGSNQLQRGEYWDVIGSSVRCIAD